MFYCFFLLNNRIFQWDQFDLLYQFKWNFSNLEVSQIIILGLFIYFCEQFVVG